MDTSKTMRDAAVRAMLRTALALSLILTFALVGSLPKRALAEAQSPLPAAAFDYYCGSDMVSSVDWMSAISGERFLHEINIPGTHDTGCACVENFDSIGRGFCDDAVTQTLSVPQQLEAGVRLLDLRVTDCLNGDCYPDGTLLLCHGGKKVGGLLDLLYYATDQQHHTLDFDTTIGQVTDFLSRHASETVIVTIKVEYTEHNANDVMRKVENILAKYSDWLYTENRMPQLREVRGKMVVVGDDSNGTLGYGMQFGKTGDGETTVGGVTTSYENNYSATGKGKLGSIDSFYKKYNYRIPANLLSHASRGMIVYTSATKVPLYSPEDVADVVNAKVYAQDGLFADKGRQFGWVYSDFVNEDTARLLWESNFVDNPDCVTVTYKCAYQEFGLDPVVNHVLRGTTIVVGELGQYAGWGNLPDDSRYREGEPTPVYGVERESSEDDLSPMYISDDLEPYDGDWSPAYGEDGEPFVDDGDSGARPEVGFSLDGAFCANGQRVVADRDLEFVGPAINEEGKARIVDFDTL